VEEKALKHLILENGTLYAFIRMVKCKSVLHSLPVHSDITADAHNRWGSCIHWSLADIPMALMNNGDREMSRLWLAAT